MQLRDGGYACLLDECQEKFADVKNCCRHMVKEHGKLGPDKYSCVICDPLKGYAYKGDCIRHVQVTHGPKELLPRCDKCQRLFTRRDYKNREHHCGRLLCSQKTFLKVLMVALLR
jgi:hypothetical protein